MYVNLLNGIAFMLYLMCTFGDSDAVELRIDASKSGEVATTFTSHMHVE